MARFNEVDLRFSDDIECVRDIAVELYYKLEDAWQIIGDLTVENQELKNRPPPDPGPKPFKGRAWLTPEVEKRLGKEPDNTIAGDVGVSGKTIGLVRTSLGIKPFHESWMSNEIEQMLGKATDTAVAKLAGVTSTMILIERKKRGIPALSKESWLTSDVKTKLGTVSDQLIATECGVSRTAVTDARRKLGIKSLKETKKL